MLELLPDKQKKAVKREYFLRLSAVVLIVISTAGVLSLATIAPSYFLSAEKEKVVKKDFDRVDKSNKAIADDKIFQSDINKTKEMISLLKPSDKVILISDLIAKIISKKSAGVKIDGISITSYKGGQYQIILKGNSASRDTLKVFAESLKNSGMFESVDLPISNFTKIADIDFNISLKTAL